MVMVMVMVMVVDRELELCVVVSSSRLSLGYGQVSSVLLWMGTHVSVLVVFKRGISIKLCGGDRARQRKSLVRV